MKNSSVVSRSLCIRHGKVDICKCGSLQMLNVLTVDHFGHKCLPHRCSVMGKKRTSLLRFAQGLFGYNVSIRLSHTILYSFHTFPII